MALSEQLKVGVVTWPHSKPSKVILPMAFKRYAMVVYSLQLWLWWTTTVAYCSWCSSHVIFHLLSERKESLFRIIPGNGGNLPPYSCSIKNKSSTTILIQKTVAKFSSLLPSAPALSVLPQSPSPLPRSSSLSSSFLATRTAHTFSTHLFRICPGRRWGEQG